MSEYVVEIKPSARRTNGPAGRLLNREGARHGFDSREEAEDWAAELSDGDGRRVWVRTANPDDSDPIDAYLVGRSRRTNRSRLDGDQDDLRAYAPTE